MLSAPGRPDPARIHPGRDSFRIWRVNTVLMTGFNAVRAGLGSRVSAALASLAQLRRLDE